MAWYIVDNVAEVPSPALLVYPDRVAQNIRRHGRHRRRRAAAAAAREDHQDAGGGAAASRSGHQPVQVRHHRRSGDGGRRGGAPTCCSPISRSGPTWRGSSASGRPSLRPGSRPSSTTRPRSTRLSAAAAGAGVTLRLFLDLDGGMHRTGIAPGPRAVDLYRRLVDAAGAGGGRPAHVRRPRARHGSRRRARRASDDAFAHVAGDARRHRRPPGCRCRPSSSAARRPSRSMRGGPTSSAARGRRPSGMPATPRRCRISRSCRRCWCSRG